MLAGMNTTALIGQWSMEEARYELEGETRSADDIRGLLLAANRYDPAPVTALVPDDHPDAVMFKDPREVGWHLLEDA
jgi:hypothetical protein